MPSIAFAFEEDWASRESGWQGFYARIRQLVHQLPQRKSFSGVPFGVPFPWRNPIDNRK